MDESEGMKIQSEGLNLLVDRAEHCQDLKPCQQLCHCELVGTCHA